MALVHAESRLTIYDFLQKEVVKKYRCPSAGKIKDMAFSLPEGQTELEIDEELALLLVSSKSDKHVELWKLNMLNG